MAELRVIAGAIMSQLAKGRSQADLAVLEIAKTYKEFDAGDNQHLLADFPVPRFSLDEVVIDLKLMIAETPQAENQITPEAKSAIVSQLRELVEDLPNSQPAFRSLSQKSPGITTAWANQQEDLAQAISSLVPDNAEVTPDALARSVAGTIRERLTRTTLSQLAKVPIRNARVFAERSAPEIEGDLTPRIRGIISDALGAQPVRTDHLGVLVTASELEGIPPEKITTVRLTFREADRTWTEYEVEGGKVKEKLVPR